MRMFKYGSRSLSHEENARVAGLQWLGVRMDDILGASQTSSNRDNSHISMMASSQVSEEEDGEDAMPGKSANDGRETLGQQN